MVNKKIEIKIDYDYCKGCEYCINFCPKKILKLSEKVNKLGYRYCEITDIEKCTGCGVCYLMCPEYIIEVVNKK